jgi:cysteinyl-tRNA synthetase
MAVGQLKARHAELVSASIEPAETTAGGEGWTLKRVQGDEELIKAQGANLFAFDESISNDLATPEALTAIDLVLAAKKQPPSVRLKAVAAMDTVFGLGLLDLDRADLRIRPKAATITEAEIEAALARRKEARAAKDFATSDALRDELAAQGVEVMDGDPLGWEWKLGD